MQMHRLILALSFLFLIGSSVLLAQDRIQIRIHGGYPPPDRSTEEIQLTVSRISPGSPSQQVDVDRYFDRLRKILAENHVPHEWGEIAVDGPFVQIDISIDKKHFVLSNSCHSYPML